MTIKNSKGETIFNGTTVLDWRSDYDKISRSWIIKGSDGSVVPSGKYTAEFWVENSQVANCTFEVTTNEILLQQRIQIQTQRRDNNLCLYCGGVFKNGMFGSMKCAICGRKKDY